MPFDRKLFFDRVRAEPFGGFISGSQVSGISAILDMAEKRGLSDPRHLAYALATTYHETARTMQPIEEYGHGRGRSYGVPAGPWHLVYDGRGDVQLTWIGNYQKATVRLKALGFEVDLAHYPEQAMRPDVAAAVLVVGMTEGWFTGAKLGHYFDAHSDDPVNARRIINGVDCAERIAGYHRIFLAAVEAASGPAPLIVAVDETKPVLAGIERAINAEAGGAKIGEKIGADGLTVGERSNKIHAASIAARATMKGGGATPVSAPASRVPLSVPSRVPVAPAIPPVVAPPHLLPPATPTGWRAVLAAIGSRFGRRAA